MRFERADNSEEQFIFMGFSVEKIEKQDFIKLNVYIDNSNIIVSIYKKYSDELYDKVASLEQFKILDRNIFVICKNGKLKFDFDLSR